MYRQKYSHDLAVALTVQAEKNMLEFEKNITEQDKTILCEILRDHRSLTSVQIAPDDEVKNPFWEEILTELASCNKVQSLLLRNVLLNTTNIRLLIQILDNNPSIKTLGLTLDRKVAPQLNSFHDQEMLSVLIEKLGQLKSLELLDLSNRNLSLHEEQLGTSLAQNSITHLTLRNCGLQDKFIQKISVLLNSATLKMIDFSNNKFTLPAVKDLIKPLHDVNLTLHRILNNEELKDQELQKLLTEAKTQHHDTIFLEPRATKSTGNRF